MRAGSAATEYPWGVARSGVRQVRGSLGSHEQGLIITTSDFSAGARKEVERPDAVPVGLMDGEQLVKLLVEHGLGVEKDELNLLRLG
ncbi:restriction endonuclease [Persicimonas caeni]|uniref:Restriction endonuclease n=1 Tax=Persicimonas caeni TaxID=2292766 RepID=A0A4Y6PPD3_PERCE|nr:restriction endonuclease [Persicimonas caeni]QDG50211.1 restriction endonuclease [Persicimonas caeni]QED31432.1 restriction endonuclease [Persicimonas caeni]